MKFVKPILLLLAGAALIGVYSPPTHAVCNARRPVLNCHPTSPPLFAPDNGEDYFSHDTLLARLLEIEAAYPNLVSATDALSQPLSLGTSHRGRRMPYVRLSAADPADVRGSVFVNGAIHAREPASMMQAMYLLTDLADRYGSDPAVTHLLDTREIFIAPLLNPDGWERNLAGTELWRKNDPLTGPAVDLNRNFSHSWNQCNDPGCNPQFPIEVCEVYPGDSAFDQPETQAFRDFVIAHAFDVIVNMHSFGRFAVEPFGCAATTLADPAVVELTSTFHRYSGYEDDVLQQLLGQTAGGGANSWCYAAADQPVSFSPEIGAPVTTPRLGFFQTQDCLTESFYPALSEMRTTGHDLSQAFLELLLSSGPSIELSRSSWLTRGDGADPGESVGLIATLRSRGTESLMSGTASVVSSSAFVEVVAGAGSTALPALDTGEALELNGSELVLRVSQTAPVGHVATILLTYDDGLELREFPLELRIGTPRVWLAADAEDGGSAWTFTNGWGIATDPEAFDGAAYFADSPGTPYPSGTNSTMTLNTPLDLSGWDNLTLEQAVRYKIYYKTDMARLSSSIDGGSTWQNVETPLGHLGYGNGAQTACAQGYTGTSRAGAQKSWLVERVDLSSFAGQADFRLRYRMKGMPTTHSELGAGFDVDAIRLLSYPDANQQITWAGTVLLDRDFHVESDQTLIVVAGTEVLAADSDAHNLGSDASRIEILVDGRMIVEADASAPAIVRGASGGQASWGGIRLRSGGGGVLAGLAIDDSDFGIAVDAGANATIAEASLDGLTILGSATLETAMTLNEGELNVYSGGSLRLNADLTIGPEARLLTLSGSSLLVADSDASAGGADPAEIEIDVQGHLVLGGAPGAPAVVAAAAAGGDWAGIRHDSAAHPSISAVVHARIDDAAIALDIGGDRAIAIAQSSFSNNEIAIRLRGRDDDTLYLNTIQNGAVAIDLDDSSPTIKDGTFSSLNQGIVCRSGSRPKIRHNDFSAMTTAIQANDSASRPNLGTVADRGYNNFDASNSWNLLLVEPTQNVMAQHNYWGTIKAVVIESRFLIATQDPQSAGQIVYQPFETSALP